MKLFPVSFTVLLTFSLLATQGIQAQSTPTVAEVHGFLNNNHFLVTYREGEVVYGTYYFVDVHYCPSGTYGLAGKSIKKTVLGNEQVNNWQEFGSWKATKYGVNVGVYYKTTAGQEKFFPAYRLANGRLSFGEGISVVRQGKAVCR